MKTYEDNKELMKNRSERTKKITIIFIIAITMRLIHLVFYKNSPYFIYPVVDAKVYLDNAIRILFGNWWKLDGVYYQDIDIFKEYNLIFLGMLDKELGDKFIFFSEGINHKLDCHDILIVLGSKADIKSFKKHIGIK